MTTPDRRGRRSSAATRTAAVTADDTPSGTITDTVTTVATITTSSGRPARVIEVRGREFFAMGWRLSLVQDSLVGQRVTIGWDQPGGRGWRFINTVEVLP
jgi:hypothetical protein